MKQDNGTDYAYICNGAFNTGGLVFKEIKLELRSKKTADGTGDRQEVGPVLAKITREPGANSGTYAKSILNIAGPNRPGYDKNRTYYIIARMYDTTPTKIKEVQADVPAPNVGNE